MIERADRAAVAHGTGSILATRAFDGERISATEFVARARGLTRPILSGASRLSELYF